MTEDRLSLGLPSADPMKRPYGLLEKTKKSTPLSVSPTMLQQMGRPTRCLRSSSNLARKGAGLNTRACAVSTWSSRLGLFKRQSLFSEDFLLGSEGRRNL